MQLHGPFLAYCPQTACKTAFLGPSPHCAVRHTRSGWRPKWADLPTLTRARAAQQWPVPKTDARIVFLVELGWILDLSILPMPAVRPLHRATEYHDL